jgi:hypothetical protein
MLYAQFNQATFQMIGSPQNLPARWTTADGATISGFNALPQAALFALGWAPVAYEELPCSEAYYYSVAAAWDAENKQFLYAAIARDLAVVLASAELAIDDAASDACARYASTGACQDMRYLKKYECAVAYLATLAAAGETPGSTVCFVTAEAEACGVSALEKAQEIVAVHDQWTALAVQIEALRIGGKVKCKACTDAESLLAQRDQTVAALGAL